MTGRQYVETVPGGSTLAVCTECRPIWRELATPTTAPGVLLRHAETVHGTESKAYTRARERAGYAHRRER